MVGILEMFIYVCVCVCVCACVLEKVEKRNRHGEKSFYEFLGDVGEEWGWLQHNKSQRHFKFVRHSL